MSALAMILTATMVVPASGPEKVSGEVEQRLDLSGDWEGSVCTEEGRIVPAYFESLGDNWYGLILGEDRKALKGLLLGEIVDEGSGRLHAKLEKRIRLGIYEQNRGKLTICLTRPGASRPCVLQGGNGQTLLILHRVKSRK